MESRSTRQLSLSRIGITSRVALCFLAMSGLGACGSSSSSDSTKNVIFSNPPDDESCLFEITDGEEESLPKRSVKESFFFGKIIDSEKIKSVYRSSGVSTVRQISEQGVDVLGVKRGTPQKCNRYGFLKTPPFEMQNLWTRIEKSIAGSGNTGEILGVFFPKGNRTGGVFFQKPTMMVGVDTNRYIVTHEYMHYLYDSELATQPGYMSTQALETELEALNISLGRENFEGKNSFLTFVQPKLTSKQNYVSLLRYLELVEKLILSFDLEEVSIESKYFDDFSDQKYEWMPDGRRNSVGYIISSVNKAQERVVGVSKFAEALIGKIQAHVSLCRMAPQDCSPEELAIAKQNETGAAEAVRKYVRLGDIIRESQSMAKTRRSRLAEIERDASSKKRTSPSSVGLVGLTMPNQDQAQGSIVVTSKHRCPRSLNPNIDRILSGR